MNYIAKYASKSEKASIPYKDLMNSILARNSDDVPAKRLISSLVIKTVGERDYSAQEVFHILFGWPLYNSSRSFVVLNLADNNEWRNINIDQNDQSVQEGRNIIEKYRSRPTENSRRVDWDSMTLLHFCKNYYTRNYRGQVHYSKKNKEMVVRVFPRIKNPYDTGDPEMYYRLHVILNVPFRAQTFDELLHDPVHNVTHDTWYSRYAVLNLRTFEPTDFPEPEDEGVPPEVLNEEVLRDPFMIAAAMVNEQLVNNGENREVLGKFCIFI